MYRFFGHGLIYSLKAPASGYISGLIIIKAMPSE